MSPFNRPTKTAALVLAASLIVSVASVPQGLAQVGPEPPRQVTKPDNNVTKALSKMFKSKEEKAKDAEASGEESAEKPKVVAPQTSAEQEVPPTPMKRPPMLTQPPLSEAKVDVPQVDSENPPVMSHPRLDDPSNPLGLTDALNRLQKLSTMLDAHRYTEARPGLIQLRQWLVDVTEAHIGLYKTLTQVPSARGQAELEKELALQFAQLRDRSMVEMAKVYIAEKDYPRAVKELTEVVKSQPRSKMGLRSYELLQEIGFTEKLQLAQ